MICLKRLDSHEERSKFEFLYEKYRYLMQSKAMEIVKDRYLAEDIVQDSFVKIADNMYMIGEVDAKETKNLIMIVTKNTAIDTYRKLSKNRKNEISVDEMEDPEAPIFVDNRDVFAEIDEENRVLHIIRNLPDKYKDVFLLKFVNGLENHEIANVLNISEGAVRQRISRGRNIIESKLEGMGVQ